MKGLIRTLRRNPEQQAVIKQAIAFQDLVLSVVNNVAEGDGVGNVAITGLPEGNIAIIGAVLQLELRRVTEVGLTATFTAQALLATTFDVDAGIGVLSDPVVGQMNFDPAVAGATLLTRGATNGVVPVINNEDGTAALYLNVQIADAGISADADLYASGTLHLAYSILGDA